MVSVLYLARYNDYNSKYEEYFHGNEHIGTGRERGGRGLTPLHLQKSILAPQILPTY